VFEMAAPIQMRGAFRHTISQRKSEHSAEIHKQIAAVYGKVMNRQNVMKRCRGFSEGRTDIHDEQRSGRPSLISDHLLQENEGEIRAIRHVTIRVASHHSRSV
jgi:hypothetical protein